MKTRQKQKEAVLDKKIEEIKQKMSALLDREAVLLNEILLARYSLDKVRDEMNQVEASFFAITG